MQPCDAGVRLTHVLLPAVWLWCKAQSLIAPSPCHDSLFIHEVQTLSKFFSAAVSRINANSDTPVDRYGIKLNHIASCTEKLPGVN